MMLSWQEILIRLGMASLFGALIGLERERKHWAAGLRTHMMVCVGASLVMIVSAFGFKDILGTPNVALDPSRIAAQVISGIGFIGAGTILLLKQGTIRGLTTAAGLWTVAAIGLATGSGLYFAAGATTVIALIILWAIQPLEQLYIKKFKNITLRVVTAHTDVNADPFKEFLTKEGIKVQAFSLEKKGEKNIYQVAIESMDITKLDSLMNDLKKDPDIKEVSWTQ